MKSLILVAAAVLFIGCGQDSKESSGASVEKKAQPEVVVKQEVPKETAVKEEVKQEVAKEEVKQEVANTEPAKVEEAKAEVAIAKTSKSGETLFKACAGCHGASGEKAALGKSQIIKGWSAAKVTETLNGYKNDTYGGAMKGVMKGQASGLSSEDINLLSEYISKL